MQVEEGVTAGFDSDGQIVVFLYLWIMVLWVWV